MLLPIKPRNLQKHMEKELIAIIEVLKESWTMLLEATIWIHTDHKNDILNVKYLTCFEAEIVDRRV